jgi:hypothetical protein
MTPATHHPASDLSAIVAELRAEVETLRSLSTFAKDYAAEHKRVLELKRRLVNAENHASLNFDCWQKERESKGAGIPADILQSLIRLCHPDRHGNSEAANAATAWLLSQR